MNNYNRLSDCSLLHNISVFEHCSCWICQEKVKKYKEVLEERKKEITKNIE